jgi:Icc-related predicted phosphoesterase
MGLSWMPVIVVRAAFQSRPLDNLGTRLKNTIGQDVTFFHNRADAPSGTPMRICFSSDFHGRRMLYDQLGELLRREQPELVILGGDMFPDGQDRDPGGTQAAFVRDELAPMVDTWTRAVPGLAVACVMGNHDWLCTEAVVRSQQDAGRWVLLELQRVWNCKGVNFLGCPYSPPSPHWVKDYERLDMDGDRVPQFEGAVWATENGEIREVVAQQYFRGRPTLAAEFAAAAIPDDPWILIAHAPPHDTNLDRLPNLDYPIGSKAVRWFVEARQPLCALHGHVHESPIVTGSYLDEVGGVLCINPGQAHERLHAVLFDTERPRETLRHTVFA